MKPEKLNQLKQSANSEIVIEWFKEQIANMNDISTHKDWADVLGKQKATEILNKLVRFLENKPEMPRINNQYK